jgi:hypothetical protein
VGLRVRVSRGLRSLFIGWRNGLSVLAGRGGSPESSGGRCVSEQRRGKGEDGRWQAGPGGQRKKEEGGSGWIGPGQPPAQEGGKEWRSAGSGSWAERGPRGKREEGGRREGRPTGKREKENRPGWDTVWAGLAAFLFSLLFFFSLLKPFKHNHLNSNKFEFKPYKLNTRKAMLQHECTNMLTL